MLINEMDFYEKNLAALEVLGIQSIILLLLLRRLQLDNTRTGYFELYYKTSACFYFILFQFM